MAKASWIIILNDRFCAESGHTNDKLMHVWRLLTEAIVKTKVDQNFAERALWANQP